MRFFCDHDVDADVVARLTQLGHQAWSAVQAALATADDDSLTVYATERKAVLVTHDREFSQRRRRNVIGWHVWLRCKEWDAADLLEQHLDELLPILNASPDLFVAISHEGVEMSRQWI